MCARVSLFGSTKFLLKKTLLLGGLLYKHLQLQMPSIMGLQKGFEKQLQQQDLDQTFKSANESILRCLNTKAEISNENPPENVCIYSTENTPWTK